MGSSKTGVSALDGFVFYPENSLGDGFIPLQPAYSTFPVEWAIFLAEIFRSDFRQIMLLFHVCKLMDVHIFKKMHFT